MLCFLHAILKLTDRCRGALRRRVLERAWNVYQAVTKAQFAQRLRRLGEWARTSLDGSLVQTITKMTSQRDDFRGLAKKRVKFQMSVASL
ncbi:MAG TPA: hypothetical protein VKK81_04640 [Candidatus Binatia bacterium]|nr:hypothetical protein [Candidatus Binatia bacterium]